MSTSRPARCRLTVRATVDIDATVCPSRMPRQAPTQTLESPLAPAAPLPIGMFRPEALEQCPVRGRSGSANGPALGQRPAQPPEIPPPCAEYRGVAQARSAHNGLDRHAAAVTHNCRPCPQLEMDVQTILDLFCAEALPAAAPGNLVYGHGIPCLQDAAPNQPGAEAQIGVLAVKEDLGIEAPDALEVSALDEHRRRRHRCHL